MNCRSAVLTAVNGPECLLNAIEQWRALVDQYEVLAPDDTQAATHGCGRLEGLHPDRDPEPLCGVE